MSRPRDDMETLCQNEVEGLHRFIEAWLVGRVTKKKEAFERFSNALADDFQIIHPSGTVDTKATVCEGFWKGHSARQPPFSIEIRAFAHRMSWGDMALVTYEEWHHGESTTARLSSALFRRTGEETVEWVHLHETWLDVPA